MTDQVTQAQLDGMTSDEIAAATREGRLDAILSGDTVAQELAEAKAEWRAAKAAADATVPEPETKPKGDADLGARGGSVTRYSQAWIDSASAEEIQQALREGKLDGLL